MAKVVEVITWAAYRDELKEWIGLPTGADPSVDPKLRGFMESGAAHADLYIDRLFVDEDGADIDWINDPAHAGIKVGVFDFAKVLWTTQGRPFGLASVKTDKLSKGFSLGGGAAGATVTPFVVAKSVRHYWRPSKCAVW